MSKIGQQSDKKQINPKITAELDERLDDLAGIYSAEKYLVANVALEYGARHFKKAWAEYNAVRSDKFRDADDESSESSNVVKFTPAAEKGPA